MTEPLRVAVPTATPYEVLIGDGLLPRCGELARRVVAPCRAAVVTDETVDALYGQSVEDSLRRAGFSTLRYAFPAGEAHKTLETLGGILEFFARSQMTRADLVVALGGGVPGDTAGFAAAVYARGIPFIQLPTTLLAAVDASVGGKTAVNLQAGKNLAGCFHQPRLVATDTAVLRALPPERLSEGAAEAIKCGVLGDPELFGWMGEEGWQARLPEIVARSVRYKRDLVAQDERDTGARQLLNFGHTFGHAIEKCSGFTLSHGQSVAIGMVLAAGAAGKETLMREIARVNRRCGLPCRAPYAARELAQAALRDKKRQGERITLVLPERIGECRLVSVPVEALPEYFARGVAAAEAIA